MNVVAISFHYFDGNCWDSLWQPCMRETLEPHYFYCIYMIVHPVFSSYLHLKVLNKILHKRNSVCLNMHNVSSVNSIFE